MPTSHHADFCFRTYSVEKLRFRVAKKYLQFSEPLHWRGMKSVGRGVREIKVSEGGEHRVFYVMRRDEGILVLHAFEKKTQRTAKSDIDLGKQRLKLGK